MDHKAGADPGFPHWGSGWGSPPIPVPIGKNVHTKELGLVGGGAPKFLYLDLSLPCCTID